MEISVRCAAVSDAQEMAEVLCGSWRAAYAELISPEELEENTDVEKRAAFFERAVASGRGRFFVAETGERICGICFVSPSRDEDTVNAGEIVSIYTLREFWGSGAGHMLMEHALDHIRSAGFSEAVLWVLEENFRAARFYEKHGFIPDGILRDSGLGGLAEARYRRKVETES